MTTEQLEKAISQYEYVYFTEDSYSEYSIRNDLDMRKTLDMYDGRNSLSEKKQVYFRDFDNNKDFLNSMLEYLKNTANYTLIPRCKRCIEQIDKMHNLVQNFK